MTPAIAIVVLLVLGIYRINTPVLNIRDDRIVYDPAPLRSKQYLDPAELQSIGEKDGWVFETYLVLEGETKTLEVRTSSLGKDDVDHARTYLRSLVPS
jgi:hypothetical protein